MITDKLIFGLPGVFRGAGLSSLLITTVSEAANAIASLV